jgi:hypothetical protein
VGNVLGHKTRKEPHGLSTLVHAAEEVKATNRSVSLTRRHLRRERHHGLQSFQEATRTIWRHISKALDK